MLPSPSACLRSESDGMLPGANVEIVTRLRSIWDDTAGTEDADDLKDLDDAQE